ncbi:MAG: hypothetical protein DYH17_16485 [Xanthomonadales bacterium PRO6]|nr:hypothetical protein [Xanthomonadales bacterium PRO6]
MLQDSQVVSLGVTTHPAHFRNAAHSVLQPECFRYPIELQAVVAVELKHAYQAVVSVAHAAL